jgi:hypothetical protein
VLKRNEKALIVLVDGFILFPKKESQKGPCMSFLSAIGILMKEVL